MENWSQVLKNKWKVSYAIKFILYQSALTNSSIWERQSRLFCIWKVMSENKKREREEGRANNGSKCANYLHKAFFLFLVRWKWKSLRMNGQKRKKKSNQAASCMPCCPFSLHQCRKKRIIIDDKFKWLSIYFHVSFLHHLNKSQEYKLKLLAFYQLSSECWESLRHNLGDEVGKLYFWVDNWEKDRKEVGE